VTSILDQTGIGWQVVFRHRGTWIQKSGITVYGSRVPYVKGRRQHAFFQIHIVSEHHIGGFGSLLVQPVLPWCVTINAISGNMKDTVSDEDPTQRTGYVEDCRNTAISVCGVVVDIGIVGSLPLALGIGDKGKRRDKG